VPVPKNELTYTECKTFGHAWEDAPPSVPSSVRRGFVLRCARCVTLRHDHIDVAGELVARKYDYPDDYAWVGAKLSKAELRLAMLKQRRRVRRAA
jgi:hypothetical protein